MTDHAALIRACAAGDKSALHRLMLAEGGRMLGIARRMLHRSDVAEDAVQEAFVLIWWRSKQFDEKRGSAKGWIFTILRNRCLTLLRSEGREVPVAPEIMEQQAELTVLNTAFERLVETSDLRRCLARLDGETRLAILSSYILGHSHGEIAGRTATPLGSIKSRLRRGLQKLKECMS